MLMSPISICCPIQTDAIAHAISHLEASGYRISSVPQDDTTHLLLPVPSFPEGCGYLPTLLDRLPRNVTVYGGFLNIPPLIGYRSVDFLSDPYYLARNAAITSECALEIVENISSQSISGHSVLILGWGRIGKCLGKLLREKDAQVTIAARKDSDLAMMEALGYESMPLSDLKPDAEFIINTIPAMVLPQIPDHCHAIELASKPGMAGRNIISALGLPGKMRPAESGKLIADTFIRLSQNLEEEL